MKKPSQCKDSGAWSWHTSPYRHGMFMEISCKGGMPAASYSHISAWILTSPCLYTCISAGNLHDDGTEQAESTSVRQSVGGRALLAQHGQGVRAASYMEIQVWDGRWEHSGVLGSCGHPRKNGAAQTSVCRCTYLSSPLCVRTLKTNTACLIPSQYYSPPPPWVLYMIFSFFFLLLLHHKYTYQSSQFV